MKLKFKLTFLDCQVNDNGASCCSLRISNSLAEVFATVFSLNVGNFQTSSDVTCARWKWAVVASAPLNSSADRTFIATLEDDFTTYFEPKQKFNVNFRLQTQQKPSCIWQHVSLNRTVFRSNDIKVEHAKVNSLTCCFVMKATRKQLLVSISDEIRAFDMQSSEWLGLLMELVELLQQAFTSLKTTYPLSLILHKRSIIFVWFCN